MLENRMKCLAIRDGKLIYEPMQFLKPGDKLISQVKDTYAKYNVFNTITLADKVFSKEDVLELITPKFKLWCTYDQPLPYLELRHPYKMNPKYKLARDFKVGDYLIQYEYIDFPLIDGTKYDFKNGWLLGEAWLSPKDLVPSQKFMPFISKYINFKMSKYTLSNNVWNESKLFLEGLLAYIMHFYKYHTHPYSSSVYLEWDIFKYINIICVLIGKRCYRIENGFRLFHRKHIPFRHLSRERIIEIKKKYKQYHVVSLIFEEPKDKKPRWSNIFCTEAGLCIFGEQYVT